MKEKALNDFLQRPTKERIARGERMIFDLIHQMYEMKKELDRVSTLNFLNREITEEELNAIKKLAKRPLLHENYY